MEFVGVQCELPSDDIRTRKLVTVNIRAAIIPRLWQEARAREPNILVPTRSSRTSSVTGGRKGVPPPTTSGLRNMRSSSTRPSSIADAASPAPPIGTSLPVGSSAAVASSATDAPASRALPERCRARGGDDVRDSAPDRHSGERDPNSRVCATWTGDGAVVRQASGVSVPRQPGPTVRAASECSAVHVRRKPRPLPRGRSWSAGCSETPERRSTGAGHPTVLEALQSGIAGQLAVLDGVRGS